MSRASRLLRKSGRALLSRDGDLLQALKAELKHELSSSSPPPPNQLRQESFISIPGYVFFDGQELFGFGNFCTRLYERDSAKNISCPKRGFTSPLEGGLDDNKVGEFTLEWDGAQTQDLVLRRRCSLGEEILVSALLGPLLYDGEYLLPRHALMKVCVVKPDFDPVLQFDCAVFSQGNESSEFAIRNTNYLASAGSLGPFSYRRPIFRNLDSQLQEAFKDYLVSRGINSELTDFLLQYLHQKEQRQYVNWLRKLEVLVKKDA